MRILFVAAFAAALALLAGATPAAAMTLTGPASVRVAATQIDVAESVALVCRNICNDWGQCRRRCWDRPDYYGERRGYRSYDYDPAPRVYYDQPRYYNPQPGIGIYGPGLGIQLGPRW
jgi:hypothetical protein